MAHTDLVATEIETEIKTVMVTKTETETETEIVMEKETGVKTNWFDSSILYHIWESG